MKAATLMEDLVSPIKDFEMGLAASQTQASLSPNADFYMSSGDSQRIMDPACFSPEMAQFIEDERIYLSQFFRQERYECIVEVGCHGGHNAPWLSALCKQYIGVDINRATIEFAQARYGDHSGIAFHCSSVENLIDIIGPGTGHAQRNVVLFPFNLFGNFINVTGLLKKLDIHGLDVAMSNFNTRSATTVGRYKYYLNCFERSPIRIYDAEQGVLFKAGECFQSIAFHTDYLAKVIREISTYHGIITPFSGYGDLFLLTK